MKQPPHKADYLTKCSYYLKDKAGNSSIYTVTSPEESQSDPLNNSSCFFTLVILKVWLLVLLGTLRPFHRVLNIKHY